jgi:hypothetical protein
VRANVDARRAEEGTSPAALRGVGSSRYFTVKWANIVDSWFGQ